MDTEDLRVSRMLCALRDLLERHRHDFTPLGPPNGRSSLLRMVEEWGELE